MRAVVNVYLKDGVLDSQGKAVRHALNSLSFEQVSDVRIGRQIILQINSKTVENAELEVKEMCEALLANTVIEDYDVEIQS